MNINELRNVLSRDELIEKNPFGVLREISMFINDPEKEDQGRELVLRALEKRGYFQEFDDILEGFIRQIGLFPYLDSADLSFRDLLAYEFHRPIAMEEKFVFHRAQAEVYRRLLDGENVILSAPTSFGKSKIIDAIIASGKYKNIAVVVPTIALIDETRRRLATFKDRYKIITQVTQEPSERNIFIFTAERINAYEQLPRIDFFIVDEFYKIGATDDDSETRMIALNQAFYRLHKGGGQFYLLGPSIRQIPEGLENKFRCSFLSTRFSTVASDVITIFDWKNDIERLVHLAEDLDEQTLIFCRSPRRVNEVARALVEKDVCGHGVGFDDAAAWASEQFHPGWIFQKALRSGIGMHHGKLPRSLAQFSVRAFNEGRLKFLVCTSTLIEGVNTKAKNVVILDNVIAREKYDFFTFNNIAGRAGRMIHHFVGRVFIFNEPPEEQFPFVDFPLFTQDEQTPESLLIQLDDSDLRPASKERLAEFYEQETLPVDLLRQNAGIDPKAQISLAEVLKAMGYEEASKLFWKGIPSHHELEMACVLIWDHFVARARSGVYSGKQLVFKINALMHDKNTRSRVEAELRPSPYQAKTPDEAVERVLEFDRNWAGFEFPRLIMALSRIQQFVLSQKYGESGDYRFFASRVEALFRNPVATALEEYGLPIQVMDKIEQVVKLSDDLDAAIEGVKMLPPDKLGLSAFEAELLRDVQAHL